MPRDYRIKTINRDKLILKLQELGHFAEISKCRPKTTWGNGCSDPECCSQHPDAIIKGHYAVMPDTWSAIVTSASSNTVHDCLQEIHNSENQGEIEEIE